MFQIRKGVFETNSSNMHAVVIAAFVPDEDYILKGIERWKLEDGSYNINVTLDETKMEGEPFSRRCYIKHTAIIDKLCYCLATIIQHYSGDNTNDPKFVEPRKKDRDDPEVQASIEVHNVTHIKPRKHEFKTVYLAQNYENAYKCSQMIEYLEKDLEYSIKAYCPSIKDKDVKVHLNFTIGDDYLVDYYPPDEFSTGCWNNEELFMSLHYGPIGFVRFILSPHSAILASTDEASDEELQAQKEDAVEILETSYREYKEFLKRKEEEEVKNNGYPQDYEDSTFGLNPGHVVWPLGG